MKYNASGQIMIQEGTGTGLFTPEGYTKYADASLVAGRQGAYSPEGYLYVTILADETVRTPAYANDGSIYVVEGAGTGWYSPCGALNVEIVI